MRLEELEIGKNYLLAEQHVGKLVAKDANNIYFNIEGEHNYLVESPEDAYPGTVGIKYYEELITEL